MGLILEGGNIHGNTFSPEFASKTIKLFMHRRGRLFISYKYFRNLDDRDFFPDRLNGLIPCGFSDIINDAISREYVAS